MTGRRDFLRAALGAALPRGARGGELRMCLRSEPKTLDPLLASDRSSGIVRYLTAGTLIEFNRASQRLEPGLAASWKVLDAGRRVRFELRPGLRFSDGSPVRAEDAVSTIGRLFDPGRPSPLADAFASGGKPPVASAEGPLAFSVRCEAPVAGIEGLFSEIPIQPAAAERRGAAAGAFTIAEHRPGSHLLLRRNANYHGRGPDGAALPYLENIRLEIQANREVELLRFRRGELHLVTGLDAELFERVASFAPASAGDAGPSLDSEILWFNQSPAAPIDAAAREWFRNSAFRRAMLSAIQRADLARVAFRGRAMVAAGPVSPANHRWVNPSLRPEPYDPRAARERLEAAGFTVRDGVLRDSSRRAVEFSLLTNSGNKQRERMAAMIQQDWKQIGVRVQITTLDFPSLLERMTRTLAYESCLLGLVLPDPDPSSQMNVWLSSGAAHQWNPKQERPATPWETEIDRLMHKQAAAMKESERKKLFDRVQQIAAEQAPYLFLLHPNALSAVAPSLRNVSLSALHPQALWNAPRFSLAGPGGAA